MRAIVRYFILLPIAVLFLAFSVANRHLVSVHIDPFAGVNDPSPVELPLFALLVLALVLGLLIGGTIVWFAEGKTRKAARVASREADRLRAEAAAKKDMTVAPAGVPALRPN